MTQPEIETIRINDVDYIRRDAVPPQASDDSYVIVRSRDQGVICGYLRSIEGRTVTITQARQLWCWESGALALPDIARHGLRGKARMSAECPSVTMLEACGVLLCTSEAGASLRAHPVDEVSR